MKIVALRAGLEIIHVVADFMLAQQRHLLKVLVTTAAENGTLSYVIPQSIEMDRYLYPENLLK